MGRTFNKILGIFGVFLFSICSFLALVFYAVYHRDPGVFLGLASLGIAFLALSMSYESDLRMKALTDLNYYEKMAMLEGYNGEFLKQIYANQRTSRRRNQRHLERRLIYANQRFLERCNYEKQYLR